MNLNVHIHALVLDGVFAPDGSRGVSFRAHDPRGDEVGPLLVTIQRRIEALLLRRGVSDGGEGFDAVDRGSKTRRPWRGWPSAWAEVAAMAAMAAMSHWMLAAGSRPKAHCLRA